MKECKKCVMNSKVDPEIVFDMEGVCNHCREYAVKEKQRKLDKLNLPWIIYQMKKQKPYHCLLGLSGGVDSSMCLHYLVEQGMKPLCFSVDNSWQTPEANENIMRMVEGLKVPYYRYVIDIPKFKELQEAFIKAGLKNIEAPTDHVLMATTYEMARKYRIKYIISGGNLATESIMPKSFGYDAKDLTHLKGVYKWATDKKLTGLPTISLFQYIWYRFVKKIKTINLLDFYEYDRKESIKLLSEKYGYKDYGEKHSESIFTKWFQNTYLFYKFHLDKRIPHFSSLINSKQMTRDEALKIIQNSPEISKTPFESVFGHAIKDYKDYPNSEKWWKLFQKIYAYCK